MSELTPQRQALVNEILKNLENGTGLWKKGWRNVAPENTSTGKKYRGVNNLFLTITAMERGYTDNRWATFNQIRDNEWHFKKDENGNSLGKDAGVPIEFFEIYDRKTKKEFDKSVLEGMSQEEQIEYERKYVYAVPKRYTVFNADIIQGVPEKEKTIHGENDKVDRAEELLDYWAKNQCPIKNDGGNKAYYHTEEDAIHLPKREEFYSMAEYYSTALHEMGHSTGHKSRLNRDMGGEFGTPSYAEEELRAEIASMFMEQDLEIPVTEKHIENNSAYIQGWKKAITDNPNALFTAIADANKIAAYVSEQEQLASQGKTQEKNNEGAAMKDQVFYEMPKDWEMDEDMIVQPNGTKTIKHGYEKALLIEDKDAYKKWVASLRENETDKMQQLDDNALDVAHETEKAVLVKLAVAGAEPQDVWLPKSQIELSADGKQVTAMNNYLTTKYGKIITKQAEIKSLNKNGGEPVKPRVGRELAQDINRLRLESLAKNVPDEMKAMPHWCVLKLWREKATGQYKKFIVDANRPEGSWASHRDPDTWTTFDKALEYAKEHNGAGLSFAIKGSGLNAFDLDHCYDKETKTWNETAKKMLAELPNAYAERSVSGTGLHIFTKSQVCEGKYNEARGDKNPMEIFETWGFISMTGNLVDEKHKSLTTLPEGLKTEIRETVGVKEEKLVQSSAPTRNYSQTDSDIIAAIERSRKADEFRSLMNGVDLCGDHSRSDAKLMNILAYFSHSNSAQMERIFRSSKLYREEKGDAYVKRTVNFAVENLAKSKDK